MLTSLAGRSVIVTGASKGIGKGIARVFASKGAQVLLAARDLAPAEGAAEVTSSITGPITGYPGWSHYAASKAGQLGLVRTAAIELAPHRITVNAVAAGKYSDRGRGSARPGVHCADDIGDSPAPARLGGGRRLRCFVSGER